MMLQKKQFIDYGVLLQSFGDIANIDSDEFCAELITEEYHLLSLVHPDKRRYTSFAKFIIEHTYPLLRNLIVTFDDKENTTKSILTKSKKHHLPREFISDR